MVTIGTIVTVLFILLILGVFGYFVSQAQSLKKANKLIKEYSENQDVLGILHNSTFSNLANAYQQTLVIETGIKKKSNIPASEFFNESSIAKSLSCNLRMLDSASGTLVGLGLLGTFLGLTVGIAQFDSSNSENIQSSIQGLLDGMGTAFFTSLFGMGCSLVYTFLDKSWRNMLNKSIYTLTEKLDADYYIDDVELMRLNQKELINVLYSNIKADIQGLNEMLGYVNESGHKVALGNAVREILTENQEQSRALKSFTTDLAYAINDSFENVLSTQLQEKILPLMESVDATTKIVIEHIDQMADTVASPASGMMHSVVEELKGSMNSIIEEFRHGLTGTATSQLEELAEQLGTATQAMGDFPKNMENISNTLQLTIEEVKSAISEISNTSASANTTAMKQMQEQIAFATSSMGNAIEQVKEVMAGMTQSSQEQSNQMVNKLSDATEKMGQFLSGTISNLSTSVADSIKNITDDVTNKQTDLIALQEDTTAQTKKLLEAFNEGLERLEKMNGYVANTMSGFKDAQGEITLSTSNLRTISGDMKLATELFNKGQTEYAVKLAQLQASSQKGIEAVTEMLRESGQLSEDYIQKFEIIKNGIGSIFSQLQQGLTEYSRTVQTTTQKYLDQYSTSLTQTTDALASTINQQSEVVEMLNETLSKNRR